MANCSRTVIEGLSDPERAAHWSAVRRTFLDAHAVTGVGTLSGTGPDLLGVVGDAASDGNGNDYTLDSAAEVSAHIRLHTRPYCYYPFYTVRSSEIPTFRRKDRRFRV